MNISKVRRLLLAITILVIVLTAAIGVATSASAATICSPATAISVPFTKDGAGDFCWQTPSLCANINSWNLTTLEVNGTAYTNIFVFSNSIAPVNGTYTIHYVSSVAWGHFEIVGSPCSAGSTPVPTTPVGPTATFTRTPTVGGPTPTRTNTPTVVVGPTATRTKTPTTGPTQPVGSWPTPAGSDQLVTASIAVSGTFDGGMKRYVGSGPLGTGGQSESQDPIFDLANGATLKNVILGNPAADGVHCAGTCTLQNVWWEDVGEDAATFRGSSASLTYLVDGGGARHASDKIFQHNGAGTLTIRNFQASDFGKLYRSCGNCSTQYKRNSIFQNITLTAPGSAVAGINTNYGDTARFTLITIIGNSSMKVCNKYTGNNTGAEPPLIGSGADGVNCIYSASDITFR
jgi:hypothetical protein